MNRIGFIGGTDAKRIIEGDWHDLWLVKTGRKESDNLDHVLPVQLGKHTEPFNIEWFEKQTDNVVHKDQLELSQTVDGVPYKGTIDGMVKGKKAIIEAKHTNAFYNMERIIQDYMPQYQLYMHLAKQNFDIEGCYLSVIFGNMEWQSKFISYSESYAAMSHDLCRAFWKHVTDDVEPDTSIALINADLSTDNIPVDQMVRRDASKDNAFVSLAQDYIEGEAKAKSFEVAKKSLKQMVADNEREVYCDQLTIKRAANRSLRFKVGEPK